MKTAIRVIRQRKNGRLYDTKFKKAITLASTLRLFETSRDEKLRVLNVDNEEVTETVLIDALMERRHTDPELKNDLLVYLDDIEAY